jgi:hypothetical protein
MGRAVVVERMGEIQYSDLAEEYFRIMAYVAGVDWYAKRKGKNNPITGLDRS